MFAIGGRSYSHPGRIRMLRIIESRLLGEIRDAKHDSTPMPIGIYSERHLEYVKKTGIDIVLGEIRIEGNEK